MQDFSSLKWLALSFMPLQTVYATTATQIKKKIKPKTADIQLFTRQCVF